MVLCGASLASPPPRGPATRPGARDPRISPLDRPIKRSALWLAGALGRIAAPAGSAVVRGRIRDRGTKMPGLVNPHGGGRLKPLLLDGDALAAERARARALPALRVTSREKGDLIMLGIGGFTPLDGFMTHTDWQGVCDGCRMTSGLFWPIPITFSASAENAERARVGADVALVDPETGEILATMK